VAEQLGFTLRFPEGWSEVPTAPDAAAAARRRFVFAPREAETGAQPVKAIASIQVRPRGDVGAEQLLARALSERPRPDQVAQAVPTQPGPTRPASTQPAPDASDEASGLYRLWRREADAVELAGLPCVVVHDVFRPADGGHPALQQRLLVTFFPPSDDVAVQFTLSSPDLLAFDDFLADGLAIAATLTLTERTPA